jgi:hypothetical protein
VYDAPADYEDMHGPFSYEMVEDHADRYALMEDASGIQHISASEDIHFSNWENGYS